MKKLMAAALTLLLFVLLAGCSAPAPTPAYTPTVTPSPTEWPPPLPIQPTTSTAADEIPGRVTDAKLDRIKMGMSYEEVKAIIGSPGKKGSDYGNTAVYSWEGETSFTRAPFTFEHNKLVRIFKAVS